MSLELINAKDRVPYNVLSNGAIRYGVYDENQNLLRYEYYKREDEPIEEGTNINKQLFDLIDSNVEEEIAERSRVDRYNMPELSYMFEEVTKTENIFPKSWTEVTKGYKYTNGDTLLEADDYYVSSDYNYRPPKIFDQTSDRWQSSSNKAEANLWITFSEAIKITNMSIEAQCGKVIISGSNDNINWDELYYNSRSDNNSVTNSITVENPNWYKIYKVTVQKGSNSSVMRIYEFSTTQVIVKEKKANILTLNNKINDYFINQRVMIYVPEGLEKDLPTYINIKNLGQKIINDTLESNKRYDLVYNGTNFEARNVSYKIIKELLNINNKNMTGALKTYTITDFLNTEYDVIKINYNLFTYYMASVVLNGSNIINSNTLENLSNFTLASAGTGSEYFKIRGMIEIDLKTKTLRHRGHYTYSSGRGSPDDFLTFDTLDSLVITGGRSGETSSGGLSLYHNIRVIGEKVL